MMNDMFWTGFQFGVAALSVLIGIIEIASGKV